MKQILLGTLVCTGIACGQAPRSPVEPVRGPDGRAEEAVREDSPPTDRASDDDPQVLPVAETPADVEEPAAEDRSVFAICAQRPEVFSLGVGSTVATCCPVGSEEVLMCEMEQSHQHSRYIEKQLLFIDLRSGRRLQRLSQIDGNQGMKYPSKPLVQLHATKLGDEVDDGFVLEVSPREACRGPSYCSKSEEGTTTCIAPRALCAWQGSYRWRGGFPVKVSSRLQGVTVR